MCSTQGPFDVIVCGVGSMVLLCFGCTRQVHVVYFQFGVSVLCTVRQRRRARCIDAVYKLLHAIVATLLADCCCCLVGSHVSCAVLDVSDCRAIFALVILEVHLVADSMISFNSTNPQPYKLAPGLTS
uniref:Uncharacterized protein n=1 Tax=Parascaris univalens TaxID=6257 RepID=A0A915A8P3_PARUN